MKRIKVYLAGRIGEITVDQEHCTIERRFGLFLWTSETLTDRVATTGENYHLEEDELDEFKYVGPFVFAGLGGHCDGRSALFGTTSHGSDEDCNYGLDDSVSNRRADPRVKRETLNRALDGVRLCDAFFAWVDDFECHGTIAEIGYAKALGKPIYIGCTREFIATASELWFPFGMADAILVDTCPREAATKFLSLCRKGTR